MTKEETCAYLTEHGVSYEITEHAAVYNMAEVAEIGLPYPEADAKNLFLKDRKKHHYYMITVRGSRRIDLKAFCLKQGLPGLSFASEKDLLSILGLMPGSVTPLGMLNDSENRVIWYLDAAFEDRIGVHPNDNTATVWLKTKDLVRIIEEKGNTVHVACLE